MTRAAIPLCGVPSWLTPHVSEDNLPFPHSFLPASPLLISWQAAFWYEGNPTDRIVDGVGGDHHFGKLKHAERAWAQAFSKHAPRLKLAVLNITAMSEGRADARVRDGTCGHFCWPGVP